VTRRHRRLSPFWETWRRKYTRRLVRDGLESDVASRLSKVVATARAGAAQMHGRTAAERATLEIEFISDGTMQGRLVGEFPNWDFAETRAAQA
jgi:hypothetical protein